MWERNQIIAIGVTALVFLGLQLRRRLPVDLMFIGALMAVTLTGVITPEQALSSFSSPAVITIAGLLIVSAGLKTTGVLDWIGQALLGRVQTERQALARLGLVLASTSAFVLNTALVAMTMPVVMDWCRRRKIAPSRMLIPISYFAILGGVCSLIGTSTTLIVNGVLRDYDAQAVMAAAEVDAVGPATVTPGVIEPGAETAAPATTPAPAADTLSNTSDADLANAKQRARQRQRFIASTRPLSLLEIGKVGVPVAIVGAIVLYYLAPVLLPNRTDVVEDFGEHRREYLVEMRVAPGCRLIGKTVEAAGLRQLDGLFLIEISRTDQIIAPVAPSHILHEGDRLVFSGVVSQIMDLEKIPGLEPIAEDPSGGNGTHRHLVEAVLSRTSPLIGRTVKESNFRLTYNAAVIAVHRNGARLPSKIGDIRLETGDTLLLQTQANFVRKHRDSRHFYLVSNVDGYVAPKHDRAVVAGVLGILLIVLLVMSSLEWVQQHWPFFAYGEAPAVLAIAVACLMILSRCVSIGLARASLDIQVLLAIVGALGLGRALAESGAASRVAVLLVQLVGDRPHLLLIVIYLMAMFFTELITNNAVASIVLPVAIGIAAKSGCDPKPFIMAVALASSLSFLTPVGYQTNLMVMGPGGYVARDYLKIGLPVALAVTVTALVLIPVIWPF